jgi:uncharacterized protein (UPF0276 family)
MSDLYSAVACNLDNNILLACLPLFEQEKIEAIEWSFDTLFKKKEIPVWFTDLVMEFGDSGRLTGHGVYFSLFSGKWSKEQQQWLEHLREVSQKFRFDHVTEHFGFMTGSDFHKGAPISVPFTPVTLALGTDRLKRIQDACRCPVGLENLAFAYSLDEVKAQGAFLEKLAGSINGFIILDLHNLYCQIHNFEMSFDEIIGLYPLDKVREIHISGGSWDELSTGSGRKIRRDTHDETVPEQVFELLKDTIPRCPNLKYVVLEQLGTALNTETSRQAFQADYLRMDSIVKKMQTDFVSCRANNFLPPDDLHITWPPLESIPLYEQQRQLSRLLETSVDHQEAFRKLHASDLKDSAWNIESWQPCMLQTAMSIAQKWKNGFV